MVIRKARLHHLGEIVNDHFKCLYIIMSLSKPVGEKREEKYFSMKKDYVDRVLLKCLI